MTRILLNGKPAEHIHILDRGLQYGDGLFETLRVQSGQVPLWSYHWQRLQKGCQRLAIPVPEENILLQEMSALIGAAQQAVVKLIITRGEGPRGYAAPAPTRPSRIMILSEAAGTPADYWQHGVRLYPCQTRLGINPALAGIKHLNRLEQVLARNEWSGQEYQEGVLRDIDGNIVEGTMSNIFWCKDNQLYTPDLSRCGVEGVMREIVIGLAKQGSISITMGLWAESELVDAEEIFISNSLIGIWPVSYIFNKTFTVGPVTRQLQLMLQAEYAF